MKGAPRLYKSKAGKFYFKFFGKKIFVTDLSKNDLIKFYHKLQRLRNLKKKQRKQKRSAKRKARATKVDVARQPLPPPSATGYTPPNLHVHDDEFKQQVVQNRLDQLEKEKKAENNMMLMYHPDDIAGLLNYTPNPYRNAPQLNIEDVSDRLPETPEPPRTPISFATPQRPTGPNKHTDFFMANPSTLSSSSSSSASSSSSSKPIVPLTTFFPSLSSSPGPKPSSAPLSSSPIGPSFFSTPKPPPQSKPVTREDVNKHFNDLSDKFDQRYAEKLKEYVTLLGQTKPDDPKFGRNALAKLAGTRPQSTGPNQAKSLAFKEADAYRNQLVDALPADVREQVLAKVAKIGKGKSDDDKGLYDDQINEVMKRYPEYLGCIANDEIPSLLPKIKPMTRICFIINTDKENQPGQHWQAVLIDARPQGSHSVEFFDSYGRDPSKEVFHDLKAVVDKLQATSLLKFKINRVIRQYDDTNTCGFMAMTFIIDRIGRHKTFSEATGYNDHHKINEAAEGEARIEHLRKYPPFKYI